MEFSKYLGVADDECSSSESGWTMYIVSPMHETSFHHHHHDHVYDHGHVDFYNMHHNEDSDDSMVSDASSAPSRQQIACKRSKKRSGSFRESKQALDQKHIVEKKMYERRQKVVKEEEKKTRIDVKAKKANY